MDMYRGRMLKLEPPGRRHRRRPKRWLMDVVVEFMKAVGVMEDRVTWGQMIRPKRKKLK